jgi:hypothetical protein
MMLFRVETVCANSEMLVGIQLSGCSMNKIFVASLIMASVVTIPPESYADTRLPALKNGMISGDVVKLWGEPVERIEEEVKRRDVWHYPKGAKVVFHESRVVQWSGSVATTQIISQSEPQREVPPPPEAVVLNPDTRDLVREIARELPSGPDVPFVESSESPVNVPVVPNPAQPMQNSLYANPPIGNQAYLADDE